jgi:hypothetical protein
MVSAHSRVGKTFRPDAKKEYDPAKKLLADRDLQIGGYLRACLRALNADPDTMLDALAQHWPDDEGEQPAWMRARNAENQAGTAG